MSYKGERGEKNMKLLQEAIEQDEERLSMMIF